MRVTTVELVRNWSNLARAALREPITVTEEGRDSLVVISAEEYARLRKADRQVLRIEELTEEEEALVEAAEVPPGHEHLDSLLDDKGS
jgi:prevent-host-death family protein